MAGNCIRVLCLADDLPDRDQVSAMIREGNGGGITYEWAEGLDAASQRLARGDADAVIAMPATVTELDTIMQTIQAVAPAVPVLVVSDNTAIHPPIADLASGNVGRLTREQLTPQGIRHAVCCAVERLRLREFLKTSGLRFEKFITANLDAVLMVDADGSILYANQAAGELFGRPAEALAGTFFEYPMRTDQLREIKIRRDGRAPAVAELCVVEIDCEGVSLRLASLRDITGQKRIEAAVEKSTRELENTVEELSRANQRVLDRQQSVIQEERLNLLLQVAGATSHEINQPLMALLGSIDLMRIHRDNPEKLKINIDRAEAAGKKIANIVRKIQTVQRDETKPYLNDSQIFDLNQKVKVLFIVASDDDFECPGPVVKGHPQIEMTRARGADNGTILLQQNRYEMILMDSRLPDDFGFELLAYLYENGIDTPVVVMVDEGQERVASRLIAAGAYDYLHKNQTVDGAFDRLVTNVQEKFRLQREVREARRQMRRQVTIDDRTGLYNRRHFMEVLEREMSRARRYGVDLAIALLAPEMSLGINTDQAQTYSGTLLAMVGRLLTRELRQSDFLCRYGAMTMAIIFPHTKIGLLLDRLKLLRDKVDRQGFEYRGKPVNMFINIGIVAFDKDAIRSPAEFVERAQAALAKAKEQGGLFGDGLD